MFRACYAVFNQSQSEGQKRNHVKSLCCRPLCLITQARETLYGSTKFNFVAATLKAQSPNWWTILSKTEGWFPLLEGCAPSRCAVLHPHATQLMSQDFSQHAL